MAGLMSRKHLCCLQKVKQSASLSPVPTQQQGTLLLQIAGSAVCLSHARRIITGTGACWACLLADSCCCKSGPWYLQQLQSSMQASPSAQILCRGAAGAEGTARWQRAAQGLPDLLRPHQRHQAVRAHHQQNDGGPHGPQVRQRDAHRAAAPADAACSAGRRRHGRSSSATEE